MYKSVKISEESYRAAKRLASEMSRDGRICGGRRVGVSNVVSEGIALARDSYARKQKLKRLAGAWKDIDADALIKEIYDGRLVSTRPEVKL